MKTPPKKLYIYEIKGVVPGESTDFSDEYLGCWREGEYSFLFFCEDMKRRVLDFVKSVGDCEYRSETVVDYSEWEAHCELSPFQVGPLTVTFPWFVDDGDVAADPCRIIIDPSVVFGSGFHLTTRMCLELLVALFEKEIPLRVLDLGCGTGILSIASIKLGATTAVAVDKNPLAIRVARKNARLNRMEERIQILEADAKDAVSIDSDLLVANMNFETIREIMEKRDFGTHDRVLLSGMVGTELQQIEQQLQKLGKEIIRAFHRGIWSAVLAR